MTDAHTVMSAADVGTLIRHTRQAAAMTQQDLADQAGTTRQWVMGLEQGHHTQR